MTDNATIRAWAAENGYACPARGKIPGRHAGRLEMSLRFRAIAEEVES